MAGFFNETDFLASGPEVGRVEVESWLEAGVGYSINHKWGQFYTLLTYESITAKSKTFDGFGAHLGYRNNIYENLAGIIQFGYLETEFHDFQLEAKLIYKISGNLALTLGLRDYDDRDYTSYETGVIYRF